MCFFGKHPDRASRAEHTRQVIQQQLELVCAPDEQRFDRGLTARLLAEGCNLPMRIAKPRFYDLVLRGGRPTLPVHLQPNFSKFVEPAPCVQYPQFVEAIGFYRTHAAHAEEIMALVITHSIEYLVQQVWLLQADSFQQNIEQFEANIWVQMLHLLPEGCDVSDEVLISLTTLARRRLYIAFTTSLARYLPDRQTFQTAFGSLPELIQAMSRDHAVFCQFMAFCQERIPYFTHVSSQIFWRTLETLQLEAEIL